MPNAYTSTSSVTSAWQTYLKKGVVLTLYLRNLESRKFKIHLQDKAIANAHYGSLYIPQFVYANSVGFGIAYPQMVGNARASKFGMSNRSDSHAFSFVFSEMNLLEFRCWECAEEKDKRKHLKIKQI